jgi:hypothetical protein
MNDLLHIRRQDYELSLEDLLQYPVWEHALDEEETHNQNERTLRPSLVSPPIDPNDAYFFVRASFKLANGAQLKGFITPVKQQDDNFMRPVIPVDLNPVIVSPDGHVTFCYGKYKPDQERIDNNYKRLGYPSTEVFPIRFTADVEVNNGVSSGILEGFLFLDKAANMFDVTETDVRYVK